MPHIVDQLIEERAEQLMRRPWLWRSLRPWLYPLLGYRDAIRMADAIRDLPAPAAFAFLSRTLGLDVQCEGLEHVPRRGATVLTPNHPTGIADGIALFDGLKQVRDDVSFFANRDALRVSPGLSEMVVPVEWMELRRDHGRRRETVRHMIEAFRAGRAVVIFPSGRLARPTWKGLVEREWQVSALNLALKYGAPVTPVHIEGRNSWLYYLFYAIHHELRDITLFRELLNKRGRRYRIRIAQPFRPQGDPADLTRSLRQFVTGPLARGETRFTPPGKATPASTTLRRSSQAPPEAPRPAAGRW